MLLVEDRVKYIVCYKHPSFWVLFILAFFRISKDYCIHKIQKTIET